MKEITNCDALSKLCTYDLLCKINDGMSKLTGCDACVIDALTGQYTHSEYCIRPWVSSNETHKCDKCIHDWLDSKVSQY